VLFAERAILFNLEPLRHIFLFFHRIVISVLAFGAGKSNPCSHDFHLRFFRFQGKKKEPLPVYLLHNYSMQPFACQSFSSAAGRLIFIPGRQTARRLPALAPRH
jgi:hypothetical protein